MENAIENLINQTICGSHRATIFSGGACLEIHAGEGYERVWSGVENELTNAADCWAMLRMVFELCKTRGILATFYPDGSTCQGRVHSRDKAG